MQKLGLALSGGGFRATLYHLGVLRYLRDAGILPKVTHINSVSGGSIIGAHLALNWDRYCGSREDFEAAAQEVIRFVQLDVRNKIVRRFPVASAANTTRSFLRLGSKRQWTRAGLLEWYYEKHLFGDVSLARLPDRPRLHILSTNLSEGCICSFNQKGMLLQRRAPGRRDRFERVRMGMATVPMAVAASSAFPGFFPPLEIYGSAVGADEGEFSRQAFTDGGVYDNLGLRMFRCLEQGNIRETAQLNKNDFLELHNTTAAFLSADGLPDGTPLRRLWDLLQPFDVHGVLHNSTEVTDEVSKTLIRCLWEVIRSEMLYRDPLFQRIELTDSAAQSMLIHLSHSSQRLDFDTRLWLNRQVVEATLRQFVGKPCLKMNQQEFDGILVSDAGGKFKVKQDGKGSGLVKTALRASDILMDRVWQLELEAFESNPGFVFIPITETVDAAHDRTALHPEIQRHAAKIRTDLDYFNEMEITSLVQHGYCLARRFCKDRNDLLRADVPNDPPWKPFDINLPRVDASTTTESTRALSSDPVLRFSRKLQRSANRRIWSRMVDFRDWPSYMWLFLVLAVLIAVPYYLIEARDEAQKQQAVLSAIADMSPDYRQILELLRADASDPMEGMPYEDVDSLTPPKSPGIQVLSDTRIFDLRGWSDGSQSTPAKSYTRLTILRKELVEGSTQMRVQRVSKAPSLVMKAGPAKLDPKLSRLALEGDEFRWELNLDLHRVPIGSRQDVHLQMLLPEDSASDALDEGRFSFLLPTETGLLEVWMLLPQNREHESFEVLSYPIGKPELAQVVVPHSRVEISLGGIASFRIIDPEVGHRYECRWTWKSDSQ